MSFPKTRSGLTELYLWDSLERLHGHESCAHFARFNLAGYVFPSPESPDKPRFDLTHPFRKLARRVGIENVRFHDLRHTIASHLTINGVDIKTVQELLGHATLTMTMRYAHLAPMHRARAPQVLDSVFFADTKTDAVPVWVSDGRLQVIDFIGEPSRNRT